MTEQMDGQVSLFDHDSWSGRTSQGHSAATTERTLPQSSKKRSGSSSRKPPLFLCLKKDGPQADASWETDGALLGVYLMQSFGECPKHGVESRLSQILEDNPHPKYYLSAKACRGILNRAARRGKDLPEALKAALLSQSESGGGCDGGGKGALVQTEVSGTLGRKNDQTVFCLQGNGIDRADTARCNGKGWKEDVCYTLNTIDRPAVCAGFKLGNSEKARSIGYCEERAPTLNAECGGNKLAILDMSHACDVIRYYGGISPSLQARMGTGGNQVPLVAYGIGNGQVNEMATSAFEKAKTLNTMHDAQAVFCQDVAHTLKARANLDFREDSETYPVQSGKVRRLTPLECERLQGFPDGWTDIGEWVDSTRARPTRKAPTAAATRLWETPLPFRPGNGC